MTAVHSAYLIDSAEALGEAIEATGTKYSPPLFGLAVMFAQSASLQKRVMISQIDAADLIGASGKSVRPWVDALVRANVLRREPTGKGRYFLGSFFDAMEHYDNVRFGRLPLSSGAAQRAVRQTPPESVEIVPDEWTEAVFNMGWDSVQMGRVQALVGEAVTPESLTQWARKTGLNEETAWKAIYDSAEVR